MPKVKGVISRRRSRRSSSRKFIEEDRQMEIRLKKERKVNEVLNSLSISLFDVCIEKGPFRSLLKNVNYINSGAFGNVYSASIENSPQFVIKEAVLNSEEEKRIRLSKAKSYVVRNSYPDEYRIMTLVNDALYSGRCPNFLLTYNLAVCENCRNSQQCYTAFLEQALGGLNSIKFTDDIIISMLFQLFAALCWLHFTYGIFHSDIKADNILVLRGESDGVTKYVIDDNEYLIKNVGFIFCLNDFGLSQVFKPNFTTQNFLGTRNGRVDANELLEPISCRYGLEFSTTRSNPIKTQPLPVRWDNGKISTENRFSTTVDPVPSIPVDLNDTKTFPPFEFCVDIQNILMTIIGGKGPFHAIAHQPLRISPNLRTTLLKYCFSTFPYSYNSAKFVRADLMLKALYSEIDSGIDNRKVTSTWYI